MLIFCEGGAEGAEKYRASAGSTIIQERVRRLCIGLRLLSFQ